MKLIHSLIVGFVTFTVLVGVALTANSAQAASGSSPYYAEPAWDRKLPASTRFLILKNWNNEAVLDKETGLVWERSPSGVTSGTWYTGQTDCLARTTGGRKGWRLPSIHELQSLVDPTQQPSSLPLLPVGHPFLTSPAFYWSATTHVDSPTLAWILHFGDGGVSNGVKGVNDYLFWCVRGGNNADQY